MSHPNRPQSTLALTERDAERQHQRGLYVIDRGVSYPIPVDRLKQPTVYLNRELWRQDKQGRVFRPGTRFEAPHSDWQRHALEFLRDRIHPDIPALYYRATLGHDIHLSTYGELSARHFHANWANPFEPDKLDLPLDPSYRHDCDKVYCPIRDVMLTNPGVYGFVEDCGWLSSNKVTIAFRDFEIDSLEISPTLYHAFDFHDVGTSATAEGAGGTDTALITPTGIARATGTPSQPAANQYRSVGTITGDVTETWQEHGLFNASTVGTLMDRP